MKEKQESVQAVNAKRTLYLTCCLLLTVLSLPAQSLITGTVSDTRGEPLPGANVYLEGTYDGTSTDSEGNFRLESKEVGTRLLCVQFIGYKPCRVEIELSNDNQSLPGIHLKEDFNEITAVSIHAASFAAGDKKKSVVLSSVDMATTAGAEGDVFGALQSLPGTTPVGESGRLFVKGGDSRESRTYIDGTLVYVPYTSTAPNTSVRGRFSPFMFSGLMFSTGGYSAEYGQALSSVLSLQTHAMPPEDQLNISVLSVGAELGGTKTWDHTSLTANLKYQNLAPYMRLFPQNRRWEKEPESISGDLSFRLRTGASGLFRLYASTNRSSLITCEEDLDRPGTESRYTLINDNEFVHASWSGEPAPRIILNAAFSYTYDRNRIGLDSTELHQILNGLHLKSTLKYKPARKVSILAGAELFSRKYGTGPEIVPDENCSFSERVAAAFLEAELYASNRLVTRLGARAEYSDYLSKSSLAPRISAAYRFTDRLQLSFSYGWYYQDPADACLLEANHMDYERADHYTLDVIRKEDGRTLRGELYYKDYQKLLRILPEEAEESIEMDNSGYGYARGLDLFWRDKKSIPNGEYWLSYSLIDARRLCLDYPEEARPGYVSRHNLSVVYKHWINGLRSYPGISLHYSSPRTYDDPNGDAFMEGRTRPYHSLDFNWTYLHKQNVIVYFSITNVLGSEQQYGYRYASSPGTDGQFARAPILPASRRFFILACFITLSREGDMNQLDKIN